MIYFIAVVYLEEKYFKNEVTICYERVNSVRHSFAIVSFVAYECGSAGYASGNGWEGASAVKRTHGGYEDKGK